MFVNVSRSDSFELIAQRSMTWRIVTYILAAIVTIFFAVMMAQIPGPPAPKETVSPPSFNVMWLIVIAIDVGILAFGSPHEIRFNLKKGTYAGKTGFLFFATPFAGSFQDFYGLCIRPNKGKRGYISGYRIELDWNDQKRGAFELVSSHALDKAQAKQQELAAKLGIQHLGCELD